MHRRGSNCCDMVMIANMRCSLVAQKSGSVPRSTAVSQVGAAKAVDDRSARKHKGRTEEEVERREVLGTVLPPHPVVATEPSHLNLKHSHATQAQQY